MAEIYNDLNSPSLSASCVPLARKIADGKRVCGLRSKLYDYQRQSIAVMVEKELSHRPVPDPSFVVVADMFGKQWFLQPSTMTIFCEPPMVDPGHGGILCEELGMLTARFVLCSYWCSSGSGKTVMILGLILATLGQLPEPEEAVLDDQSALTPLAYRHFPMHECITARDRTGLPPLSQTDERRVPSLVEILLHHIRLSTAMRELHEYEDELKATNLWQLLHSNTPFYLHSAATAKLRGLPRSRRPIKLGPRIMYLSSATLVIVPLTLLGQWHREIQKHCLSDVRYLMVHQSGDLPAAKVLATDYDVRLRP